MIDDKDFCKKQCQRMAQLDGFPRDPEAARELVSSLQYFDTQQQAERFVGEWMATERVAPKPADIRKVAYDVQQADNTSWLEKKQCPDCSGSGFRMEVRIMRATPGMATARYEFAVKCDHSGTAKKPQGVDDPSSRDTRESA